MRRGRAVLALALGLPLAAILLLTTVAWYWLQAEPGHRWLIGLWQKRAAAHLGAELRVGALQGNPLWEMRAKDLCLTLQGRDLLKVEEVEFSHNPLALLGGRLLLGRLVLTQPQLDLPADWQTRPESSAFAPLRLAIEGLRVTGGSLRLSDHVLRSLEDLDLNGWLSLDALGLRGQMEIARGRARVAGLDQCLDLSASIQLQRERLSLASLALNLGPARLEAKGEMTWARATTLKAGARLSLPAGAKGPPWTWLLKEDLDGSLELDGPLEGLRTRVHVAAHALGLHMQGRTNLKTGSVELTGGLASGDLMALGLTDFPLTLGGRLQVQAQDLTKDAAATARARLDLNQARSGDLVAEQGHVEAAWKPGSLELTSLELGGEWGRVQGRGALGLPAGPEPQKIYARLQWQDLTAPPALAPRLPSLLRGSKLQGYLAAKGSLADLALDLDLGPSLMVPDLEINRLRAKGGRRAGLWRLESITAQAGDASFSALGRADNQGAALDLGLQIPDLQPLSRLLAGLGLDFSAPLKGALEAKASIQGPWSGLALKLEAQARGLSCPSAPLTWEIPHLRLSALATSAGAAWPLQVSLDFLSLAWGQEPAWTLPAPAGLNLGPHGVTARGLVLTRQDERLSLEGRLDAQGRLEANLSLSGLRPASWLTSPVPLESLRLSGQARMGGSLAAPQANGSAVLSGLVWTGLPPSELRLNGDLRGGRLQLRGEVFSRQRRLLGLSGGLDLDVAISPPRLALRPQGMDLALSGHDLPLALLEPITPFLSGLKGKADLEVTLRGSPEQPNLQGRASLSGGGLTITRTGQTISDIELGFRLDGRRLLVDKASARSGGTLNIAGQAVLPLGDPGSCDLEVTARAIKIGMGSIGEITTDADLHIGGTPLHPLTTGRARPSQARILPRLAAPLAMADVVVAKQGQKLPPIRRERRKAPRIVLPGPLAPLSMDAIVDLGSGLRVAVDEGWLELAGQTVVRKEPQGPLTFHQGFAIQRGVIMAAGKAFEVQLGQSDFASKDRPDPDLKVEAILRTGTTQILVQVGGSAFETRLSFSSEPPLSQADILSTIIFGRPARTLTAGESQQLSAQALALLGLRGKAEMERLLGSHLAPDVVAVHNEMQTGPSLEAGKYLSPDLYLRYRQNMGTEGGQNVGLELKLKPYLSLESQVGSTRDNGADMIFSFDFD